MTQSRRPRRRRADPVKEAADRIFAAAFKSLEEARPNNETLAEIAAAALRVTVMCLDESLVPEPGQRGWTEDGAIADLVRIMAMRVLQEDLRQNGKRLRPLRDRFGW